MREKNEQTDSTRTIFTTERQVNRSRETNRDRRREDQVRQSAVRQMDEHAILQFVLALRGLLDVLLVPANVKVRRPLTG